MSVNLNKLDPELQKLMRKNTGTIRKAFEFCKRHKDTILTGIELQAIQARIDILLGCDDDFQKEKKELKERYAKELDSITTRYIESYIKEGLL